MAIGERDVIEVAHPTAPSDAIYKRLLLLLNKFFFINLFVSYQ